jgi:deazaflavin-dependent oxidoreductase (nitroreductase family)
MGYLELADRSWPLLRRLMAGHTAVYRATGGAIGHRLPGLRARMLLLDHVGARSGRRRSSPLLYFTDGADVVLVASKGGFPSHPAWFHNLRANPDTTVQIGGERRAVHARVATAAERKRLWPRAVRTYGPYADYQRRTDREIPLVILSPRDSRPAGERP